MKHQKIILAIVIVSILSFAGALICFRMNMFGHHIFLVKSSFDHLSDWEKDDHLQALETLQKSCVVIAKRDPSRPFSKIISQSGKVEDWQKICLAIDGLEKNDALSAKKFFESWFVPYHVYDNLNAKGLFTGYYLSTLKCRLEHTEHYNVPIHAIPDDLVKVDLGLFDAGLAGRTFVGQVKDHKLYRYPDKEAITKGAIDKKAKVLAWCDDKIDVAFAHVQGSAIVELPEKKHFLIGYEGANGRPYTGLAKVLIKENELTLQKSSMQDIRTWLLQHPDRADEVLNKNASYVFFRILKNSDPLGSEQVPLTPERSLAVDKRYLPLGVPIWLDTVAPNGVSEDGVVREFFPYRRLFIAQDTGGAIRGIVRGDVYWGSGERAAFIAGHMKSQGEYWILLPRL